MEELNLITSKNAESEDRHQKQLLDMETEFHRKIIVEYEKNKELLTNFHKLRDESNAKLRKTAGYLEDTIESMESDFKQQIEARRDRIHQLIQYNDSLKKEFVEYCRQEKVDFERQLVRVRLDYEKRLLHEQEVNNKWRNEAGVLSKKYNLSTREGAKLKEDFLVVHDAHGELKMVIEEIGQEKEELRIEIQKLHNLLADKSRMIEDVTRQKSQLEEAMKEVEDEFAALQRKLEPKEEEIRVRLEEMRILEIELETLNKNNAELERILSATHQKHEGLTQEVKQKTMANQEMKTSLSRVIAEIHLLNDVILKPDLLKAAVVKLYSKWVVEVVIIYFNIHLCRLLLVLPLQVQK